MASSDLPIDLFKLWTQSDADSERKIARVIEGGLDQIRESRGGLFARIKKGPDLYVPVKRWMEEHCYELKITAQLNGTTLTFSGNLLGEPITEGALRNHVTVNTVLERRSDGLQVKVTAMDSANYAAKNATVAAHGNSGTLSNDASAVTYDILGQASSDYDTTYVPGGLDRRWRKVGTQIMKKFIEMPETKVYTKMEVIADELQHQIKEKTEQLYNEIAMCLIRMLPVYAGGAYKYGDEVEGSAMLGLSMYPEILQGETPNPNVYVNANQVAIDFSMLNSLIISMETDEKADFERGDWVIAMDRVTHQYFSDEFAGARELGMKESTVGYEVTNFRSKLGKVFPVMREPLLRLGTVLVVDTSGAEYGYYGNQHIRVKTLPEEVANVVKKKITCQTWGTLLRLPRQRIGKIYNLPTTYSA